MSRAAGFRALLAVAGLVPGAALAEDAWVVPEAYRSVPGQPVKLRVAAGTEIDRIVLIDGGDTAPVAGSRTAGRSLDATITPNRAGHAVVVATAPSGTAKAILCIGDTSGDSAYAKPPAANWTS